MAINTNWYYGYEEAAGVLNKTHLGRLVKFPTSFGGKW